MQKFNSLTDAIALAEFAHRNQLDKAGLPYIDHPKRVLAKVQAQGALPYVQIAAILHDVTEDTAFNSGMLIELGFSEAAVQVIELLDRGFSERVWWSDWKSHMPEDSGDLTIDEFNKVKLQSRKDFYYLQIRDNPAARLVKLADIEDNMSPWRLSYLPEETQKRLTKKYARAKLIIEDQVPLDRVDSWMTTLGY